MITDYSITGNQLIDGLILSQLLNIIVNNVNYIINLIKLLFIYIYDTIIGRIMISLVINNEYDIILDYLNKYIENMCNDNKIFGNNLVMISSENKQKKWYERLLYIPMVYNDSHNDKSELAKMTIKKVIIFKNKRIWIIKEKLYTSRMCETKYKLMTINWNIDKSFFTDFFNEIETKYGMNDNKGHMYQLNYRVYRTDKKKWHWIYSPGRTFDSVYVKDSIRIDLMNDIKKFKDNRSFYDSHNIPYQRGYLFHGPPGTGKTSIVKVIASIYKMSVFSIKLSDSYITDSTLESIILDNEGQQGIYLFEDIDALFNKDDAFIVKKQDKVKKTDTEEDSEEGSLKGSLTYTGFINLLSGINNSFHNCFIVMTTNNIDKLPASLIRPGRIDKMYHIDYADANQLLLLTKSFYPNQSEGDYHLVVKMIMETYEKLTIALVQNFYINHMEFEDMIKSIDKLLER